MQFLVFWLMSMNAAWQGPKPSGELWLKLAVGFVFGGFILIQVRQWTKQVQKDLEHLDSQVRWMSGALLDLKKEQGESP